MKIEGVRVELTLLLGMLYLLAHESENVAFCELLSLHLLAVLVFTVFATAELARQTLLGGRL